MANLDTRTHDESNFNAEDYDEACRSGTCNCAPRCGRCGKHVCYDAPMFPGWHDFVCPEPCGFRVEFGWKKEN
jgi:hypothetical protein